MKTCPACKEQNENNNTKCFNCGIDLTAIENASVSQSKEQTYSQTETNSNSKISNAEHISSMSVAVCVIGLILSIILGNLFQTETVIAGLYSTRTEYGFNWGLCIGTAISTVCFTIILRAMFYIAKAIEEK